MRYDRQPRELHCHTDDTSVMIPPLTQIYQFTGKPNRCHCMLVMMMMILTMMMMTLTLTVIMIVWPKV